MTTTAIVIQWRRLIPVLIGLVLAPDLARAAAYTRTDRGITLMVQGKAVTVTAGRRCGFCLSVSANGTPAVIDSVFIAPPDGTVPPWQVAEQDGWYGIKSPAGQLIVKPDENKFTLVDATGHTLIANGTFATNATGQEFNIPVPAGGQRLYGSGNTASKSLVKRASNTSVGNGFAGVPYYWSTAGYNVLGVTANDEQPAQWNSDNNRIHWTMSGSAAALYLMPAKTLYAAMDTLTQLTGRPLIPPRWVFGYLQSRWGWESRAYIEETLGNFRTRKLPVDAFIYDFEWYTKAPDYKLPQEGKADYADFAFNPALFPDPVNQIAEYKKQGVKFVGIRKPRLGNSDLLTMAREKGWCYPNSRDLKYSDPQVRAWWAKQNRPLLDAGADAWWNDEGEKTYTLYYFWNKAQADDLQQARPHARFWSINRAFSPGLQRLGASAWTGDISASWRDLKDTPKNLLNWSLAGMTYSACDIGGFGGSPSATLLTRWMQAGVFFPVMRAHSVNHSRPHFPWLFGAEAEAAMKSALELRYRILPMLYSLGHTAYRTGAPVMRPLVMEFPDDPRVADLTDQWLIGTGLMPAPILTAVNQRTVYLPAGRWYTFDTGYSTNGPVDLAVKVPLAKIPVYVRAGSIIPLGPIKQYTDEKIDAPLEVQVYAGRDASFTLLEDDGKTDRYQHGQVRTTDFRWDDAKQTLSWTMARNYRGDDLFTRMQVVVFTPQGRSETTAPLAKSGTLACARLPVAPLPPLSLNLPARKPFEGATGTGLKGEYFDNRDLTNLKLARTDAAVNFDWAKKSPDPSIQPTTFSIRWTGQVQPRFTGKYTFTVTSDDGARLWVNGKLIIDAWVDQAGQPNDGVIELTAGQRYDIRLEYFQNGGESFCQLEWSSEDQQLEIIPQQFLYPPVPGS